MPAGFGWYERAVAAAETLVPWLVKEAPGLRVYVEEVLNSPALLREAWAALKPRIDAPSEVARIDDLLTREGVLLAFVAGDTVSIVVTGYLLARYPNGRAGRQQQERLSRPVHKSFRLLRVTCAVPS